MIRLAWRYLWSSPLTTALNLLLLTLGLAAVTFVLRASAQVEAGLKRDLAGIDLVVGAKGSPMQIMLAGVFHLDSPTGNIPLATLDALDLANETLVVVLGDHGESFTEHRIYFDHHGLYDPTLFLATGGIDVTAEGEQSPLLTVAAPANLLFILVAVVALVVVRGRVGRTDALVGSVPVR